MTRLVDRRRDALSSSAAAGGDRAVEGASKKRKRQKQAATRRRGEATFEETQQLAVGRRARGRRARDRAGVQVGALRWCDGPLVQAMRRGEMLLLGGCSARCARCRAPGSVLEVGRTLTLVERGDAGTGDVETLTAADGFGIVATMNPGGDFEARLSPRCARAHRI